MFENLTKIYLVHIIPLLYWIYLISLNYSHLLLVLIISYVCLIIVQALVKEYTKNMNTQRYSEFFKNKKPFLIIPVFFLILFGFVTFIVMIFNEKNFLVWSLIITYGGGFIYGIVSQFVLPTISDKRKQIQANFSKK